MKHEISVEPAKMDMFAWNHFLHRQDTADPRIQRMKKIMRIALDNELTQRQHDCITMRYFENLPVSEIALRMNIKPTTVYKHLKKAVTALKKCSLYL